MRPNRRAKWIWGTAFTALCLTTGGVAAIRKIEQDRQTIWIDGGSGAFALSGWSDAGCEYAVRKLAEVLKRSQEYRWIHIEWRPMRHDGSSYSSWALYDRKMQTLGIESNTYYEYEKVTEACITSWAKNGKEFNSFTDCGCIWTKGRNSIWNQPFPPK